MNRSIALWMGLLSAPLIWLCSFEARFVLAPWACTFQNKWALHGVTFAAFILCLCSAFLAFRQWKALGQNAPTEDGSTRARSTFLAILGLVISCGCAMIVVAQSIPEFMLGACM